MGRKGIGMGLMVVALAAGVAPGQDRGVLPSAPTDGLEVPSVYAPPALPSEDDGVNEGGVTLDLTVRYVTDYIFRGLEILEVPAGEDTPNLQVEIRMDFDFKQYPKPFVGLFSNVANQDPISDFQEIRPFFGFVVDLRPFTLEVGHNTFFYPDREDMDTSEVWARVVLDDAWLWSRRDPILSPYVMAAYDYDRYDGWYFEAGVQHDVELSELGLVLTFHGAVAYVQGHEQFSVNGEDETGFQHYRIGLTGRYSLNKLLNTSRHYGDWSLVGYINYTGAIEDTLRADDQLWGGAALNFRY